MDALSMMDAFDALMAQPFSLEEMYDSFGLFPKETKCNIVFP